MILGSVSGIFKQIYALFKSMFTHYTESSLSLSYSEHRHIQKFDGVRCLSDILQCFWKMAFARSSFSDHFRCLAGFSIRLCIYKCCLACIFSFRFCFRDIQIYSSIIQEHTHAYSELCVSLLNSEPWHTQAPKYIHNTILNIF